MAYIVILSSGSLFAQDKQDPPEVLNRQTDAIDVIKSIFTKKRGTPIDTVKKKHSTFSILPSAGYNPSVGFSVGVTSTGGKIFGDPKTTTFSVFNANAYTSTFGLSNFEFKNNLFTNHDKFNLQGSFQMGTTVALDYGIGTGRPTTGEGSFAINGFSLQNNSDVFPIAFSYVKFNERIYKEVVKNVYAGAGVIFNFYNNIDDERLIGPNLGTHNYRYSVINGYPTDGYKANGLLFNVEYNTRDHINRPYHGLYIDLVLRFNEPWMGSNQYASQLKTEVRKYWSLSKKNPEHILAYWLWGSYLLDGSIPYLELVGTGSDATGRLGRAYTVGRFKGANFFYNELEYRFPITKNKLFSGVAFANAQTASNARRDVSLFQYVEPGGGVGLRLLFNKYSRSCLCIDYGRGVYGSSGLFLGLNEVF
ncbi:MAG: BamA/TamA family outer membrane protein [Mucilaginibacter sp.]